MFQGGSISFRNIIFSSLSESYIDIIVDCLGSERSEQYASTGNTILNGYSVLLFVMDSTFIAMVFFSLSLTALQFAFTSGLASLLCLASLPIWLHLRL